MMRFLQDACVHTYITYIHRVRESSRRSTGSSRQIDTMPLCSRTGMSIILTTESLILIHMSCQDKSDDEERGGLNDHLIEGLLIESSADRDALRLLDRL